MAWSSGCLAQVHLKGNIGSFRYTVVPYGVAGVAMVGGCPCNWEGHVVYMM